MRRVNSTLVMPSELTELEERELLLDDLLEAMLERTLEEPNEELDALDCTQALPVIPNGDGWLVQVAREIQLLLFSYPQPLCVVTHRG
jgi:hypothetical protein